MRILLVPLVALANVACLAQSVEVAVVGGFRTTSDLAGGMYYANEEWYRPASKRYAVGPALAVDLPLRLGVEIEALYRRERYDTIKDPFGLGEWARTNIWEFPMLISYSLPISSTRPFLEAGCAPRVGYWSANSVRDYLNIGLVAGNYDGSWTSVGMVFGGGMHFTAHHLQFSPSLRYTRWNDRPVASYAPLIASENQLDLFLKIGWSLH